MERNKKNYETPIVEIVTLIKEDIITLSKGDPIIDEGNEPWGQINLP